MLYYVFQDHKTNGNEYFAETQQCFIHNEFVVLWSSLITRFTRLVIIFNYEIYSSCDHL